MIHLQHFAHKQLFQTDFWLKFSSLSEIVISMASTKVDFWHFPYSKSISPQSLDPYDIWGHSGPANMTKKLKKWNPFIANI